MFHFITRLFTGVIVTEIAIEGGLIVARRLRNVKEEGPGRDPEIGLLNLLKESVVVAERGSRKETAVETGVENVKGIEIVKEIGTGIVIEIERGL